MKFYILSQSKSCISLLHSYISYKEEIDHKDTGVMHLIYCDGGKLGRYKTKDDCMRVIKDIYKIISGNIGSESYFYEMPEEGDIKFWKE